MAKREAHSLESYRAKASDMISLMYDKTSSIAENHAGQNRGIAAGTAASILSLGMDRLNRGESPKNKDGLPYSDEELDYLGQLTAEADSKNHFVDRLLERLVKHAIPGDIPETEEINLRIHDPERAKKPGLSLKLIMSNFKRLSGTMSGFFRIQYGIIHVVSWRQPTKTLSCLVLYTAVCLWPHLVLVYPLLLLLFGVMIPGYIHRHPMRTPEIIKVKKRGQSLLDFFNQSSDSSVIEDILGELTQFYDHNHSDNESHKDSEVSSMFAESPASSSSVASAATVAESSNLLDKKKDKTKFIRSQMTLMVNMRDLQNLTTDVLKGLNAGQKFWHETVGFNDERKSTFIFYGVAIATSFVTFAGQFIPWRQIFISSGWIGLALCHPNSKKYLMQLKAAQAKKKKKEEVVVQVESPDGEEKEVKRFDRNDIIIDDSAEVKTVEIYELHVKSVLKNNWSFSHYTTSLYDLKDPVRAAGQKPHGVSHLSKVFPPPDWKFDLSYADKWEIDTDPKEFLQDRAIKCNHLKFSEGENEGWIYDNLDDAEDTDIIYEFRRRRLYRECYRYSVPPVKIKYF